MNAVASVRRIAHLSCLVLIFAAVATAQSTGGRVRGTVSDQTGASIAGATVSLVNNGTNSRRDVQSSANGEYVFVEVPVGTYSVEIAQSGFKKYSRTGIVVNLNEVVSIDAALQLGATGETVEVTGAAPIVDTTSTQLGAVVNERSVVNLPLAGRDTYQLLQLQPGVQSQLGLDLFYGSDKSGVVSVNGGRGRSNNYSVNGGEGNDQFANLPAIQPSPDSIEEFRVLSNTFDAEYGRNSGSVINVVTKSGTNSFHGSVYEFFRNKALNAKGYYDVVKPDFKQNDFGGTLGGPLRKDKTFFFVSEEEHHIVRGISSQPVTLPTAGEAAGNFGSSGDFSGTLTDPTVASIFENRAGCRSALQPASQAGLDAALAGTPTPYSVIFPGLQVPTGCFDPVALSLYNRFVAPFSPNFGTNQYVTAPISRGTSHQGTIRLDHQLTANQKLSLYYFIEDDSNLDPFARFQAGGSNLGTFPGVTAQRIQQINASHTATIGAASVNELRFTYFREGQGKFNHPTQTSLLTSSCGSALDSQHCFGPQFDVPITLASGLTTDTPPCYGLSGINCGITPGLGASHEGVPDITVGGSSGSPAIGGFSIGNNFEGEIPQVGNTYELSDNFSKVIGNHSIKFGEDFRYQKFDQTLYYNVGGNFSFTSDPNSPTFANDLGFTDAYPDYFLGLPSTYSQGAANNENLRNKSIYLFAQDSWKVKPNLTFNYGLRWELNTPYADLGHKVQAFRPGQATTQFTCTLGASNPLVATFGTTDCGPNSAGNAVFPLGLVVPGDKGVPNGLAQTYYHSFAPRLGLNWSPGWTDGVLAKLTGGPNNTSISMGWGLFYNPIEQLVLEQFGAQPPFGGSQFLSGTLFSQPFVSQSGTLTPNPYNGILSPTRGGATDLSVFRPIFLFGEFPNRLRSQYSAQYNLTIKRELPGNMLLQFGYVGTQGHRLLATYDNNPGNPQTCLDIENINGGCAAFGADVAYTIPAGTIPAGMAFHLPYTTGPTPGGPNTPCPFFNPPPSCVITGPNANDITLVGLRPHSSPFCDPATGTGCPPDGKPVFSSIFAEDTVANSNYNSFQALFEKRFNHGLQFQASYTLSKSIDNASSFENVLDPLDFRRSRSLSFFDSRHRFAFNYFWELPIPKMQGFAEKVFNGWATSGIITAQSGFPIRITSGLGTDQEFLSSSNFESAGEPDLVGKFTTTNPRKNGGQVFDPNLFQLAADGTIGNSPRTICCGPGLVNVDIGFHKNIPLSERLGMQFRTEIFNLFNHAQFTTVDGDISSGSAFGKALHVRDPRLIQFGLKLLF